jgi:cytochrome c
MAAESVHPDFNLGRAATAAELQAWDIDVRPDFKGLPEGSGTVDQGLDIWESTCATCHGSFGEKNTVFTPLVGGTTPEDIETGHVASLVKGGQPSRTTFMKVPTVSTLWDYIHRAMPWDNPKSLKTDEVYAVLAYLLNLAEVVPSDFTLSDKNMAEVQEKNAQSQWHEALGWAMECRWQARHPQHGLHERLRHHWKAFVRASAPGTGCPR